MGLGCPLLLGSSARRLRRCAATVVMNSNVFSVIYDVQNDESQISCSDVKKAFLRAESLSNLLTTESRFLVVGIPKQFAVGGTHNNKIGPAYV